MLFRRNREVEAPSAEAQGDLDDSGPDPLGTDLNGSVSETDLFEDEETEDDAVERTRRSRFGRSRGVLRTPLLGLRRRQRVDEKTLEELEEALILADVGISTTQFLLGQLRAKLRTKELSGDFEEMIRDLEASIIALFDGEDRELHRSHLRTTVWLFVGVNGVGKTTTIGKLAGREVASGHSVVLAAGDTFRAAAGDQLALWSVRSGADIVQGADGADPSSVVYDAIAHAHARGADLVLADSAGRLQNKTNLMEELKKIRRVADREPGEVTEVLLVLDATTGQNGLTQAREFARAVEVSGVVLTKLDGTAKGGIVLAIRHELGLPIKLVGLGEQIDDLVVFDPVEFAAALFEEGERE
ncbi:MAG TPA: signal recognition particle-docking protein FtsY [Acidimicrobiales bacterium]|nr:signal recognition particle-docking protein FtsY [Acidimicrobiales bacterium]